MPQIKPKFDPTKLLKHSPEGRKARCPHCGTKNDWTGVDVTMAGSQSFGNDGVEEDYGTYLSEIGDYEYVTCNGCGRLVWYDPDYYRPDAVIDALLRATQHGLMLELGGILEDTPGVPSGTTSEQALEWLRILLAGHRLSALLAEVSEEA